MTRLLGFYRTSIGKKIVMAGTGIALLGFVIGHLLGNLQVYLGPEKLNAYAEFLHENIGVLWLARIGLLVAVVLHVDAAVRLTRQKHRSRKVAYTKTGYEGSDYASRTMMWSGPIILLFVIYHLAHFTWGTAHHDFQGMDVYHNVVSGFSVFWVSALYIAAMIALGFHLYHGIWSFFQTLGLNHPRWNALRRCLATLLTVGIVAGNISIPLAVLTGFIK
ncbi:MAG: succinate dehydrogenase cytochrome b subunit [Planctomycetota bacterium]